MEAFDKFVLPAFPLQKPVRRTQDASPLLVETPSTTTIIAAWNSVILLHNSMENSESLATEMYQLAVKWDSVVTNITRRHTAPPQCHSVFKTHWSSFIAKTRAEYTGGCLMFESMMFWMNMAIHLLANADHFAPKRASDMCRQAMWAVQMAMQNYRSWTKIPNEHRTVPELMSATYECLGHVAHALAIYYYALVHVDTIDGFVMQGNMFLTAHNSMKDAYTILHAKGDLRNIQPEFIDYLRYSIYFLLIKAHIASAFLEIYRIADPELYSIARAKKMLQVCLKTSLPTLEMTSYREKCKELRDFIERQDSVVHSMEIYKVYSSTEAFIDRNPRILKTDSITPLDLRTKVRNEHTR